MEAEQEDRFDRGHLLAGHLGKDLGDHCYRIAGEGSGRHCRGGILRRAILNRTRLCGGPPYGLGLEVHCQKKGFVAVDTEGLLVGSY
jgi:hypothetical protein